MQNFIRHGDLLLKRIEKLPEQLTKLDHQVLAHGESGHRHLLVAEPECQVDLFTDPEGRMFFGTSGAKLTHEEHKTITIEPGIYFVEHEREFDPFQDVIRQVRD